MKCNLCGENNFDLRYKGNLEKIGSDRFSQYHYYGDLYKCKNCGLISQKLIHSFDEIASLLANEKYLDEEIGTLNVLEKGIQFRKLIKLMQRTTKLEGASLLDVGANTGVFLNEIKLYSTTIKGIEPSKEASSVASKMFKLDVQNALISSASIKDNSFDIITLWDVIEHLYDPNQDLGILFKKLKPGGIVYISTHNVEGWFAKLMGANYPNYMYQHFFHFSHDTLSMMLQNHGFEVIDDKRFCKSWSFGYLYEMLEKIWPQSFVVSIIRYLMRPLLYFKPISKIQIAVPIWDFFLIAGQRPKS